MVVIGAGFMGLATALALADGGVDVTVIEAAEVGWGASGRNNGLLTAGLKRDPDEVRKLLGDEPAERLLRLSGAAPAEVARLVDTHDIDCDLRQDGWLQAAHSSRALPLIERRVRDWQALGADVKLVDRASVRDRLGTSFYAGAWYDPRGGSLNPLAFVRGLAHAATNTGIPLFPGTPALSIDRIDASWRVITPQGELRCDNVVACTNAYNDLLPELRGTVMPLRTAQVASAPLRNETSRTILPGGESASDTQRLLTSFRLTADNRLIMGGGSATAGDENSRLFACLYQAARDLFPELGDIDWEYGWSGYLALTDDHLPQILRVDDGFFAGIGCNGRGIAMATVTGQAIAKLLLGENSSDVPVTKPRRITGFSLRRPGVAVGVVAKRLMDVAERHFSER